MSYLDIIYDIWIDGGNLCLFVTYLRISVQIRVRARWKNLTFLSYEFGKGQYAFYPVKLSRSINQLIEIKEILAIPSYQKWEREYSGRSLEILQRRWLFPNEDELFCILPPPCYLPTFHPPLHFVAQFSNISPTPRFFFIFDNFIPCQNVQAFLSFNFQHKDFWVKLNPAAQLFKAPEEIANSLKSNQRKSLHPSTDIFIYHFGERSRPTKVLWLFAIWPSCSCIQRPIVDL